MSADADAEISTDITTCSEDVRIDETASKPWVVQDEPFEPGLQKRLEDKVSILWIDELEGAGSVRSSSSKVVGLISHQHYPITDSLIAQFPNLMVISNHGAGYSHIDHEAAKRRGILVGHTPGVVGEATANLAMGLILCAARNIISGAAIAKDPRTAAYDGNWFGTDVSGSTLGIVGFGNIGTKVARRARACGMKVLYHSRRRVPKDVETELQAAYFASLDELLPRSDFVLLSVPLTKETTKLIGYRELCLMKRTAILVNVARGKVVDQDALVRALVEKRIQKAALDVTYPEPLPRDHPLLKLPACIVTPHIGTAVIGTRTKMLEMAIENLLAGINGNALPFPVPDV